MCSMYLSGSNVFTVFVGRKEAARVSRAAFDPRRCAKCSRNPALPSAAAPQRSGAAGGVNHTGILAVGELKC